MIPLKDNIPTGTFPIVTVLLIVINLAFFVWQETTPNDEYSSPDLQRLGIAKRDEQTLKYGAIPYRLTHPGANCAVGVNEDPGEPAHPGVVCEGTPEYDQARSFISQGAPFASLGAIFFVATIFFGMFMHAGILHIAGNMLFLWVFGNNIEARLGKLGFLVFYLLAGVVAIYAQSLIGSNSTVPIIGASGAVAGVLGAYILLHPKAKVLTLIFIIFLVTVIEIPAAILLGIWFILQFIPAISGISSVGDGGVAYFAHVGGFAFGLLVVKLLLTQRDETTIPPSYPPAGYG